jgi:hypothetical protein
MHPIRRPTARGAEHARWLWRRLRAAFSAVTPQRSARHARVLPAEANRPLLPVLFPGVLGWRDPRLGAAGAGKDHRGAARGGQPAPRRTVRAFTSTLRALPPSLTRGLALVYPIAGRAARRPNPGVRAEDQARRPGGPQRAGLAASGFAVTYPPTPAVDLEGQPPSTGARHARERVALAAASATPGGRAIDGAPHRVARTGARHERNGPARGIRRDFSPSPPCGAARCGTPRSRVAGPWR